MSTQGQKLEIEGTVCGKISSHDKLSTTTKKEKNETVTGTESSHYLQVCYALCHLL